MSKGDPFYYHKPGVEGSGRLATNRNQFRQLRDWLKTLPQTRELSVALTKLQEAAMWSNAAIVLTDPDAEVIE